MNITLTKGQYTISDNRITITTKMAVSIYTLPLHCRRIVLYHHGPGANGQLVLGGFKSITVTVVGPYGDLEKLWDAVL